MGRGNGAETGADIDFDAMFDDIFDDVERFALDDSFDELIERDALKEHPKRLIEILLNTSNDPRALVEPLYDFVADGGLRGIEDAFRLYPQTKEQWQKLISAAVDVTMVADMIWARDLESPLAKHHYAVARRTVRTLERAAAAGQVTIPAQKLPRNPEARSHDPERLTRQKERLKEKKRQEEIARDEAYERAIVELGEVGAAIDAARKKSCTNLPLRKEDIFRADIAHKLHRYGSLSEGQINAIKRGLAFEREREQSRLEHEKKMASAPPVTVGRYEFEGKVLKADWYDGYYGCQRKMTIELDDGNRLFGAIPASLEQGGYLQRGDRVRLTGTVENSKKGDPHFGIFKHPKKAALV